MNREEIINKIMNTKPNEKLDFDKWTITIERNIENYGIEKGQIYFIIHFKRIDDWHDNWITINGSNTLTNWKTLNGAKRYILKKMEFYTGLEFVKNTLGEEK